MSCENYVKGPKVDVFVFNGESLRQKWLKIPSLMKMKIGILKLLDNILAQV